MYIKLFEAIKKLSLLAAIVVLIWSIGFIAPLQGCRCNGPDDFCSSLGSNLDSEYSVVVIAEVNLVGSTRMQARLVKRLFGDPLYTEFWIEGGDEGDCITNVLRFKPGQLYLFHLGIYEDEYYTTICRTDWLPIEDGIVKGAFSPTMIDRPLTEILQPGSCQLLFPDRPVNITLDERSEEIHVSGFDNSDRLQWVLVDLYGRVVDGRVSSTATEDLRIPLPDLPAGSYFFRISDGILSKTQLVISH